MSAEPVTVHSWPVGDHLATLKMRQDRATFVEWQPKAPTFLWREELAQFYAGQMEAVDIIARRWPGMAFSLNDPVVERIASLYDRRGV